MLCKVGHDADSLLGTNLSKLLQLNSLCTFWTSAQVHPTPTFFWYFILKHFVDTNYAPTDSLHFMQGSVEYFNIPNAQEIFYRQHFTQGYIRCSTLGEPNLCSWNIVCEGQGIRKVGILERGHFQIYSMRAFKWYAYLDCCSGVWVKMCSTVNFSSVRTWHERTCVRRRL